MNKYFLILILILQCKVNTNLNETIASGTFENPELESDLRDENSEYQPYLDTSNKIMDLAKLNDFKTIVNQYFAYSENDNEFLNKFISLKDQIDSKYGKFKSYKKRQWNFSKVKENQSIIIQSVKIVNYKKGVAYIYLNFIEGRPKKIVGFFINDPPPPKKLYKLSESYEYNPND